MSEQKYRVHRFEYKGENIHNKLEKFLNDLAGVVITIIPEIKKCSLPQIYGVTGRVDFLIIIEKI